MWTKKTLLKGVVIVITLLITTALYSHGNLSLRIKEKTKQISKNHNNPVLYFERGFLFQQHHEYKKAISDYLKSEELGYSSDVLHFRKSESYYYNNQNNNALHSLEVFLKLNSTDVKAYKLQAQILYKLNRHTEALHAYKYVLNHMVDIRPEDVIEYSTMVLTLDPNNYTEAIEITDIGLNKLGNDVLTLQLKKLEYLKRSKNQEAVLSQYNHFIITYSRKEFWYYKKAKYLFDVHKIKESKIALQQAKFSIESLDTKFQNIPAIKDLMTQINELEKSINHE